MQDFAEFEEVGAFTFNVDGMSGDSVGIGGFSREYCFGVKLKLWDRFLTDFFQ